MNNTTHFAHEAARQLAQIYRYPCAGVLGRLMEYMYRVPPVGVGPEYKDGRPFDVETLAAFQSEYATAYKAALRMRRLMGGVIRRGVPHVVSGLDQKLHQDISSALLILLEGGAPRLDPVDAATAFLPEWIDSIARYLLLVHDRGPIFACADPGIRSAERQFVADTLAITGWDYPDDIVDEVCATVESQLSGKRSRASGLSLSSTEKEELIEWRLSGASVGSVARH